MGYKQIIIVRKDLGMSSGKMSAQVSHASMAFLTTSIRANAYLRGWTDVRNVKNTAEYEATLRFDTGLYEEWIDGSFTKVVLEARNKNQLLKAKFMAEELGMKEGEDFFLIKDNCLTELEPEEDGKTLTCIGFKPMDSEVIDTIGRKYHLFI